MSDILTSQPTTTALEDVPDPVGDVVAPPGLSNRQWIEWNQSRRTAEPIGNIGEDPRAQLAGIGGDEVILPSIRDQVESAFNVSFFGGVNSFFVDRDIKTRAGFEPDPNYDFWEDPIVQENPRYWDMLARANPESARETRFHIGRLHSIKQDYQNVSEGDIAPFYDFAFSMIAPDLLIGAPIGLAARTARGAWTAQQAAQVASRAGQVASKSLLVTIPQEAFHHDQDPYRQMADSAAVIGVTAGLVGLVSALPRKGMNGSARARAPEEGVDTPDLDTGPPRASEGPPEGTVETPGQAYGAGRSVGAAQTDEASFVSRETGEVLSEAEQDAIFLGKNESRDTVVGLEKLGWNPINRSLKSPYSVMRAFAEDLMAIGQSTILRKNLQGEATSPGGSFEVAYRRDVVGPLAEAIENMNTKWLASHGDTAERGAIATGMKSFFLGQAKGKPDFVREVAHAIREPGAQVSQFARDAAEMFVRKVLDPITERGLRAGVWTKQLEEEMAALQKQLDDNLAAGGSASDLRNARVQDKIADLQARIDDINTNGLTTRASTRYFPRLWNWEALRAGEREIKAILENHFRMRRGLHGNELRQTVERTYDNMLSETPIDRIEEARNADVVAPASSLRERVLDDLPDAEIEDFLENDVELVLRHWARTVGTDVLLTEKFGDITMNSVMQNLRDEAAERIARETNPDEIQRLTKARDVAISDVRALRDRARGTYGLPSDPYRFLSRAIRNIKAFNNVTMMGMAPLSAMTDFSRIGLVQGFKNGYGPVIEATRKRMLTQLLKMSTPDLRATGVGTEMAMSSRAMAISDMGDIYMKKGKWDRRFQQASNTMFFVSGMNQQTQFFKEIAGNVSMFNLHRILRSNNWQKKDGWRIAQLGIDAANRDEILKRWRVHGQATGVRGHRLPNFADWPKDDITRQVQEAIYNDVERVIITPGLGDRALLTSTEFGGLITQYTSFAQAATMKSMQVGLQERDAAFFIGAAVQILGAGLVAESKAILSDRPTARSLDEFLMNGVALSGVTGIAADLLTTLQRMQQGRQDLLSLGLGPTGSQANRLGTFLSDVAGATFGDGKIDRTTLRSAKGLIPYNQLWWHEAATSRAVLSKAED